MDARRLQFSGDSGASEPRNGAAYPEVRRQSLSPELNYFGGDDPAIAALRRFQNMSAVSNRRAQEGADAERRPSTNQKGTKSPKQEKDKIDPPRSRLETIFFSVLHSMVTGNEVHSSFAIPLLLFEDIQLLYFAWHPGFKFSGMPDWIQYLFNPLVYRPPPGYYALFIVMFSAAWLLVAILIGTITFCAISFDQGKFKYIFPLTLLRAGTQLALGILNVPVIEILLGILDCDAGYLALYPEIQCYQNPAHLIPYILSLLGLILFVPYTLLMSLAYVDGNPRSSKNPMTKSNGRTDFLYLTLKLVILIVWEFVDQVVVKLVILVACLLILTKEILHKQPMHNETLQYIRAGVWTTATFSAAISLGAALINDQTSISFILLCAFLLPGALLGAALSRIIRQLVCKRVYRRFRLLVERANLEGGMVSFAAMGADGSVGNSVSLSGGVAAGLRVPLSMEQRTLDNVVKNIDKLTSERILDDPPIFEHPHEVELSCRFVRHSGDPRALILAREIFEAGFLQFPKDGYVKISAAFYLLAYSEHSTTLHGQTDETNEEKADLILDDIFSRSTVSFDVRFLAFLCQKEMEQSRKSKEVNSSSLNVSSFVEILSQEKYAKIGHLETLNELKAFWTHVRRGITSARDFESFPAYLRDIASATKRADDNYRKLLDRFPRSKMILRLYAQFRQSVLSDNEEAKKLLALADELEATEAAMNSGSDGSQNEQAESLSDIISEEDISPTTLDPRDLPKPTSSLAGSRKNSAGGSTGAAAQTSHRSSIRSGARNSALLILDEEGSVSDDDTPPVNFPVGHRRSSVIPELRISLDERRQTFAEQTPAGSQLTNRLARKAASSHGTNESAEGSKASRRAKLIRLEFAQRVQSVPEMYRQRLNILSLIFLVVICFSLAYSNVTFSTLSQSASDFLLSTDIGRYAVMMIQSARLMSHFGSRSDATRFNFWRDNLIVYDDKLFYIQKTYLVPRSGLQTDISRVLAYDYISVNGSSGTPNSLYYNQFEVAKSVQTAAEALLKKDISYFSKFPITTDINLRYLLDNFEILCQSLKGVSITGEHAFVSTVSSQQSVIWVALFLSVAVVFCLGLAVLHPLVSRTRDVQVRYLKNVSLVPRKAVDEILLAIDEQLEILSEDTADSKRAVTQENNRKRGIWKSVLNYCASLGFLGICAVCLLAPVLARLPLNIQFIQMVNFTNQRKYWTETVKALSYEVLLGDNTIWMPGRAEALLKDALEQYEAIHRNAMLGYGVKPIQATTTIDLIYWLTEDLGCMVASCDPSVRNFNSTIGFAYNETVSPLDNMINDFLQNGRQFLAINGHKATMNFDDDRLRFMQEISLDIQGGLYLIDTLVLQSFLPDGNAKAQTASVSIFVVTLVSFLLLYALNFQRMVDARSKDMETLVNLFYMIPVETINAIPKLQRLLQSAGASISDDEA